MRPLPYDLVFGHPFEERFLRIRDSLAGSRLDPSDPDQFILDREVAALLRELVPEEGVGTAITEHLALLHHAYLYWSAGGWVFELTRSTATALLEAPPQAEPGTRALPEAYYLQLPERLVWGELEPGAPHEPLDGMFVRPWPAAGSFVLAIFGVHSSRDGFTVVEVDGYPEPEDDIGRFAPRLPGGAEAGLFSITAPDDLLALAARCRSGVVEAAECVGPGRRPHQPIPVG
jgi:hypothetical protein